MIYVKVLRSRGISIGTSYTKYLSGANDEGGFVNAYRSHCKASSNFVPLLEGDDFVPLLEDDFVRLLAGD